jgi:hypothetical protein
MARLWINNRWPGWRLEAVTAAEPEFPPPSWEQPIKLDEATRSRSSSWAREA